jgi:probable nitrogen fixation protein
MNNLTLNSETNSSLIEDNLFLQELVKQVRAQDNYGVYRSWNDELVLANFIVSKQQKSQISVEGEVDVATQLRILYFHRAIAARIEKETNKLCQVAIDLSHEGFGWALVWTGHLIVLSRTLRDAHRFGYSSLKKLATQGDRFVDSGINTIEKFPEAAND